MQLAERMTRIGIESAFEVLQKARALEAQGKNIVHLEIGQPDFPTPAHVKEAAKRALDEGWTGYGPTPGFPDFRQAIAEYISTSRGISVTGQNVVVVPGGKPIMFFSMLAVVEPGDEVIYPNPGFPIYESVINFLGATPVPIPLVESRGFSFDLDLFESKLSSRTKMVVLNSPANPTGGVIPRADLARIADLVRNRDLLDPERRDLLAHLLRRGAFVDHAVRRHAREDDHPGRLLQDLLDDRLAAGLRRDAAVGRGRRRQADGQLELVHRQLHAASGTRRAQGPAGRRGQDGGGVPPPPRRHREGPERDPRVPLLGPGWRVLRVPECHRHRVSRAASWRTCCSTTRASRA